MCVFYTRGGDGRNFLKLCADAELKPDVPSRANCCGDFLTHPFFIRCLLQKEAESRADADADAEGLVIWCLMHG
jgi:hypothetical protein